VTTYLTILALVIGLAVFTGWRLGRRNGSDKKLSSRASGILLGLGIFWILAAKFARGYADTDGFGCDLAGWFAHSGKWLVLLAAMAFGHGWICGSKQIPTGIRQRIFYHVALLGMIFLCVAKSIPIFFLLDAGRRDTAGLLRQSERIEVTCGAVALLNYLERCKNHPQLSEREVAQACGVTLEGTTTAALIRAARHYGLTNATARVLTATELENTKLPVIVSISTMPTVHHATLLFHLDTERADFIDPAYGFWSVPRKRFEEIWYGRTILLE
jgi:hypothetical protein